MPLSDVVRAFRIIAVRLALVASADSHAADETTFHHFRVGQVRPLALSPDGTLLLRHEHPDATPGSLQPSARAR
jgi:hypothetical protein